MLNGMGDFELIVARRFLKDIRKLQRQDQLRVRRALDDIRAHPYRGRKVTAAVTGQYRWRVGNLRIRYDIEDERVQILRVLKRDDAYR